MSWQWVTKPKMSSQWATMEKMGVLVSWVMSWQWTIKGVTTVMSWLKDTNCDKGSDVITASHKGSEVMTVSHAMTVSHRGRTAMIAQRERCHKTPKGSMSCQWATEELLMQQWRQQKGADMTHWQSTQWKDVAVTVNKWNYGIMMCQQSQWKGDDTVTGNRMKRRCCCNSQHKGKTMR